MKSLARGRVVAAGPRVKKTPWNTGWEGYPWSPAGYFFDTPDGWGSYNLWNREGKPDGVGYYKAEKNCDDPENCYLQFWCLDDDGHLYYHC